MLEEVWRSHDGSSSRSGLDTRTARGFRSKPGARIANSLCSSCHQIEPGSEEGLKTDVPSFSSIANRPGQTEERLAGTIILSPHPEMPKVALTTRELGHD